MRSATIPLISDGGITYVKLFFDPHIFFRDTKTRRNDSEFRYRRFDLLEQTVIYIWPRSPYQIAANLSRRIGPLTTSRHDRGSRREWDPEKKETQNPFFSLDGMTVMYRSHKRDMTLDFIAGGLVVLLAP